LNIQISNYDGNQNADMSDKFVVSKISAPKSLDEFDINIIDLTSESLWEYNGNAANSINDIQDIVNLNVMLSGTQSSKMLIILPRDLTCYYNYGWNGRSTAYNNSIELKNCLNPLVKNKVLKTLIPHDLAQVSYDLSYENTTTHIDGFNYEASFHFHTDYSQLVITKSRNSDKITTLKIYDRLLLTTINVLESENHLQAFLKKCGWLANQETYPEWLINYSILDDMELNDSIAEKENTIHEAEACIANAREKLESNLEYKSILFVNGESLVNTVYKILEEILEIDLSGFEDKKKEDFLIKCDDNLEFIGEIKGVTSNVKSEHVSQLDVHYQKRLDDLTPDEKVELVIKALLIINPLRTTAVNDRQPVNEEQVKLAIRNGALIIETTSLLYIYENFVSNKLSPAACKNMLRGKTGLLTKECINQYFE